MKKWYEEPINVKRNIIKEAKLSKDSDGNTTAERLMKICEQHNREYDNSLYTLVM